MTSKFKEILVRKSICSNFMALPQQLLECQITRKLGAQEQVVSKIPNQPFQLAIVSMGNNSAYN